MARKFKTYDEAKAYVESLPINSIIGLCVALLMEGEDKPEKVIITQEQFNAFFKIRGLTAEGEREKRGRKPKNQNPEGE